MRDGRNNNADDLMDTIKATQAALAPQQSHFNARVDQVMEKEPQPNDEYRNCTVNWHDLGRKTLFI